MKVHVVDIRTIGGEQYAVLEPVPLRKLALSKGQALELTLAASAAPATAPSPAGAAPGPLTARFTPNSPAGGASAPSPPVTSPPKVDPGSPPGAAGPCCVPHCRMKRLADIVGPFIGKGPEAAIGRPDQTEEDANVLG